MPRTGGYSKKLGKGIPQLPTGDIHRTADFCESKLGFSVEALLPEHGHLILSRDDAEIHFWQTESEQQALELGAISSCYIRVRDIEALFAELSERGAPFRYELTDQPWGMREMQVDEPYGNALRFGEPLRPDLD